MFPNHPVTFKAPKYTLSKLLECHYRKVLNYTLVILNETEDWRYAEESEIFFCEIKEVFRVLYPLY